MSDDRDKAFADHRRKNLRSGISTRNERREQLWKDPCFCNPNAIHPSIFRTTLGLKPVLLLVMLMTLALFSPALAAQPLTRAHAHNDYEHKRPLLDALDQAFCSVEADIYLVTNQLLVAHNLRDVKPERTIEKLYLDPLRERVRANRGHVYSEFATNAATRKPISTAEIGVEFTLLIDLKTGGEETYRALRPVLSKYAEMLTRFTPTSTTPGAVTVILTGNRPVQMVAVEPERLCALDGRLSDLDANPSVHLFPLVSESWSPTFKKFEASGLSEADRTKLRQLISKTHSQGRRLRFWGVPDQLVVWREFYSEGVDMLNTDDLPGLAAFLQSPPKPQSKQ